MHPVPRSSVPGSRDRKSTRLNSSHDQISYAVFCLKKKNPYGVRDVYGSPVIPENLGNVSLKENNHNPPRFPADILASAHRNLLVRDGVASFFYHPHLGTSYLRTIVEGIQNMGYTFVPANASLA